MYRYGFCRCFQKACCYTKESLRGSVRWTGSDWRSVRGEVALAVLGEGSIFLLLQPAGHALIQGCLLLLPAPPLLLQACCLAGCPCPLGPVLVQLTPLMRPLPA